MASWRTFTKCWYRSDWMLDWTDLPVVYKIYLAAGTDVTWNVKVWKVFISWSVWLYRKVMYLHQIVQCTCRQFDWLIGDWSYQPCLTLVVNCAQNSKPPVRNQQICNRSVLPKTDQQQTNLASAESVFSLCRRSAKIVWNDFPLQTMNRSKTDLQIICKVCNESATCMLEFKAPGFPSAWPTVLHTVLNKIFLHSSFQCRTR